MNDLKVEMCSLAHLERSHLDEWTTHIERNPVQNNPMQRPEFLQVVARSFPDCQLIAPTLRGRTMGYIPVQLTDRGRVARAIPMCDYQTFINLTASPLDVRRILQGAGIDIFKYTNATAYENINRYATYSQKIRSPRVDTSIGFDGYVQSLRRPRKPLRHLTRDIRKLEAKFGEIRLDYGCADAGKIKYMLELKQLRLQRATPFEPEVFTVLSDLAQSDGHPVRGIFSKLTAGGHELGYAYTLNCGTIEFLWFFSYRQDHRSISLGSMIVLKLIERLCELKRKTLDLGPGGEEWKEYFANDSIDVSSGRIDANPFKGMAVKAALGARRKYANLTRVLKT